MIQTQTPFKLPSLADLKTLNEAQLCKIFFELEKHRSNQLFDASEEYTRRIDRIEKEYAGDFQILADVLAEVRSKTA